MRALLARLPRCLADLLPVLSYCFPSSILQTSLPCIVSIKCRFWYRVLCVKRLAKRRGTASRPQSRAVTLHSPYSWVSPVGHSRPRTPEVGALGRQVLDLARPHLSSGSSVCTAAGGVRTMLRRGHAYACKQQRRKQRLPLFGALCHSLAHLKACKARSQREWRLPGSNLANRQCIVRDHGAQRRRAVCATLPTRHRA